VILLAADTMNVDATLQAVIRSIVPEAALIGAACVLFLLSTSRPSRSVAGCVALLGIALAAMLWDTFAGPTGLTHTAAPVLYEGRGNFFRVVALLSGAVLVWITWDEPDDRRACEYQACLLCVVAGLSLATAANDLIFLFLALELISIPTYVMLYLARGTNRFGQEAAVKYFLLSILSSAFLLFGFSYLYGLTGTTNITATLKLLPVVATGDRSDMAIVAAVMIVAGLGFKITAFPFHFYAPDVYQGGPVGVVALLAFVPKVAGFAVLLRLFGSFIDMAPGAYPFTRQFVMLIWILAAVTMTAGNVLALLQNNFRRMLAYSGVAHAGYMLIGLAVLPSQTHQGTAGIANAGEAVIFYLIAYGAMTIGPLAVIAYLNRRQRTFETIDDFGGLHESNPCMAACMALFLFSLIGLPLTAGFVGKFLLFMGALTVPIAAPMGHLYQVLAIVGAVNAAIAAYYYLRVVGVMYLRGSFQPPVPPAFSPILIAIVICAVLTILLGVYPAPLLDAIRTALGSGG
jgi:NADH-quinone oxidoreductase subunit N